MKSCLQYGGAVLTTRHSDVYEIHCAAKIPKVSAFRCYLRAEVLSREYVFVGPQDGGAIPGTGFLALRTAPPS